MCSYCLCSDFILTCWEEEPSPGAFPSPAGGVQTYRLSHHEEAWVQMSLPVGALALLCLWGSGGVKTLTWCIAPQLGFSPPLSPSVWKPDLHRDTVISRPVTENKPLWWCWKRMVVPWWCPLGVGSLLTASLWCTCPRSGCEKTLICSDRKVFFSDLSGWRWPFIQVWGR